MTHWVGEAELAQYEQWLELVKKASAQARSSGFAIAVLRSRAGSGESPAWTKEVNLRAFASMDAGGGQETVLHVYWSAIGDARDAREGRHGHRMQRDKVAVSLGLDRAPDPGFTPAEMQSIAYAAKIAAIKCLMARRRSRR
ncbi:MAG: hypothetical protein IT338_17635 [Thermomicrobiales bacterium]|nr:hypothetical protein [Thermomicrobiales bacterium]